ncbi:hypothetical protein AAIR29_09880 [Psychrobacter sp. FBL11]|uniref:Uncharacterized protein n=1 Tax=Psychrobacter saeujeotis TaxID=3143436 RepID=A0ABU9X956_9GAMM|nr:hypothetical protein [uncultured Psychrobacter sp.]
MLKQTTPLTELTEGYENPMAKVRDEWKGELADGGKKTGTALYGAAKDAHDAIPKDN